jgi:hypothetical protein
MNGGSLPVELFLLHRLPYRTDSVHPVVFLITHLHRQNRKHSFQQYPLLLHAYPLPRERVKEPLPRNECCFRAVLCNGSFSGSTFLALSKYATILFQHFLGVTKKNYENSKLTPPPFWDSDSYSINLNHTSYYLSQHIW